MSIHSIGLSGLNAAQMALKTTSNNVSNVYTPGHNREIAQLANNAHGGGVKVTDVQRQFDHYVADQLNASLSNTRGLEAYRTQVDQINNLLADREAGLSPLMQSFFSSIEDLAASPSDPASRQGVLGTAGTMAGQFRAFSGYLNDMQQGVNDQIKDEITQINNLTEQFATLNREISLARATQGTAPNGLLDQRDQIVKELNQRMDVRLNIQDGTTYNLSLPNGQQLVTGTTASKLVALEAPNDPQRVVIGYQDGRSGDTLVLRENLITGGTLGGLMSFRGETLDKTQNQLGQLAVSMVVGFNDQHRLGRDLAGDQGADFFGISDPVFYANDLNNGTASITDAVFDPENVDELRATDYEVRVTAAGVAPSFEVIRKDNGQALDASEVVFDDPNDPPTGINATLSFGGVTLTFDDVASLAQGDRFEVQPVRNAAAGMDLLVSDTDEIAAGALMDVSGDMAVESVVAADGAFAAGSTYELALSDDGRLHFTDGAPGEPTLPVSVQVNGETRNLSAGGFVLDSAGSADAVLSQGDRVTVDGISFTITEVPGSGDPATSLTFDKSLTGPGDNRNALALQGLQSVALVAGRATLTEAYAGIVSDVGNRTNIVQVNLDASEGITEQLEALQQSASGVNLDEEAANLIRFQQFYAANARVIDTASTMLDTILGLRT